MNNTYCNESCQREFTLPPLQVIPIGDDIEKNCFFCPWCGHEYIAFYTDAEIRGLQERIRKVDREPVVAPHASSYISANWRHAVLEKKIKDKMAVLRERVGKGEVV